MNKIKKGIVGISILIGDFFLFYLSLYLALFFRKMGPIDINSFHSLTEPFFYIFLIWFFILFIIDFYELTSFKKTDIFLRGVFAFLLIAIVSGTVYFYFQPQLELTPRAVLFLTALNFTVLLFFWRLLLYYILGMRNFRKKVLFIGFCKEMEELIEENSLDYEISGVYSRDDVSKKVKNKIEVTNSLLEAREKFSQVDVLVIAPNAKDDKQTIKAIFSGFPFDIKYMEFSSLYEEMTKKIPLDSLNEWWFLENISRPQKKSSEIIGRFFQLIISLVGMFFLLLLFPIIAFFIKIDSRGPIFYCQERTGRGGKNFILYKFRTMHPSGKKEDVPWREEDKSKITRIGLILRKTHLDELPQIYNILKGDLCFVGPRPETKKLSEIFEENIPFYKLRYLVRPGLTGWAQINYPPSMSVKEAEEKFRYDLYYIKNRSFFLDFIIVLKTIRTVF